MNNQFSQSNTATVLSLIVLGMLIGSILREVNKKTKFPYTPMLLLLGLIVGYYRKTLGIVKQSTDFFQQINPQIILFIFIPVLIFESAFHSSWYVFKKSLINILMLSIPGVLLGTFILAVCFKILLFYSNQDLSWRQALTIGSILSATDPTAIITLLKQLGSTVQFNTLIEGQSLINCGTSMILFSILINSIKEKSFYLLKGIWDFSWLLVGGVILGMFFGYLLSRWLKRIFYDNTLISNLTLIGCYLLFFLAQFTWIKVSGIISVVTLGLYLSASQKTTIYSQSQESLHSIWNLIQYICQTLIYLLTGVIIGVQIIQRNSIFLSDWIKLFIFWLLINGSRFLMVVTFYPLLKLFGYGMTKKQLAVTVLGGIKGSLSLCLALIVMIDSSLNNRFRELTIFYTSGITLLTVLINGLACKRIIDWVQIIVSSPVKQKMLALCLKRITKKSLEKLEDSKTDKFVLLADWKKIIPLTQWNCTNYLFLKSSKSQKLIQNQICDSIQLQNRVSLLDDFNKKQIDEQARFRLLCFIKSSFYQCFDRQQCSSQSVSVLSNTVDILLDKVEDQLNIWSIVVKHFTLFDIKYWLRIKDWWGIGKFAQKVILNRICFIHDICSTLVTGCHEGISLFLKSSPIKKQYLKVVISQIQQNLNLVEQYLSQLQHNYQNLFVNVHTLKLASNILSFKRRQLYQMKQKGYINQNQFDQTKNIITNQTIQIKSKNQIKWDKFTFQDIVFECPMFSGLSDSEFKNIRLSAQQKQFRVGQMIQTNNSNISLVYVVIEGIVQQSYHEYNVLRSIGGMLSLYSIVAGNNYLCSIKAQTPCTLLCIQLNTFRKIMKQNKQIEERVYKGSFPDAVKNDRTNPMSQYPDIKLRRLSNRSILVLLQPKQFLNLQYGGYLFSGQLKTLINQKQYPRQSYEHLNLKLFNFKNFIVPGLPITSLTSCIILMFKEKYYQKSENNQSLQKF